jgi:hypothetical protein
MADTFPITPISEEPVVVAPTLELGDLPYMMYDKEEFDSTVKAFGGDTGKFVSSMVGVLQEDFPDQPDFITYQGLRNGTAPILNSFPDFAGLGPSERRLSNEEIIRLFATDLEGDPIEAGTMLKGAMREAIPIAATVPTFMGGFSAGQYAVAGVPPVGPAAILRFGLPLVAGAATAGLGYFVGEKVNEAIQGEESPITPGTSAAYEAGKTAVGALAWLPMPYMVPAKLNFGVELAEGLVKEGQKIPLGLKIARGLENTVGSMGAQASANPFKFAAAEAVAGAGATAGAYGAENLYEGSGGARIGGELLGGVSFALLGNLFAKRLPTTLGALKAGYKAVKEGRVQEGAYDIAVAFKGKREGQVTNYILDLLEESSEDIDAVIAALTSKEFESMLLDEAGNPIALTSALKSGSPTLAALEKSLEQMAVGLSKERNSANVQADRALRNVIVSLYGTGDKDAIQEGALLAQSVFDAELENSLLGSMQTVMEAFDKVAGKRGPEWAAERQATLGQKLFNVIEERFKAGRAQERTLWRNTGQNLTITEFVDADGNVSDMPNFMSYWEDTLPTTIEAADEVKKPLNALNAFVVRKRNELFPDAEEVAEVVVSPRLRKTTEKFEDILDSIRGTQNLDQFQRIREQADGIADVDEKISFLRQQASLVRRNADQFEDRRLETRTANAIEEFANIQRLTFRDAGRETAMSQAPGGADGAISIQELTEMRTTALSKARMLAASGDSSGARVAYGFAEALMRDLESFPQGVDPAYDTARAYSRAFNDAYTRTFAGDILGVSKTGAAKVAPEMIANDIFNADAGYLRSLQLDGIGKFELTQSLTNLAGNSQGELKPLLDDMMSTVINTDNDMIDTQKLTKWVSDNAAALDQFPQARDNVLQAVNTTTTVRGTTETILRNIRAAAYNPETGVVNVDSLNKWMAKPENVDVLNAMPALKADLENSVTANLLLKAGTKANAEAQRELSGQVSFMDLLPKTTENPATAFARAFSSKNSKPIQNLTNLWKVVENAPESWVDAAGVTRTKTEAADGFRSSLIESLYTRNGQTSNSFSPKGLYENIFLPHPNSPNKITLAEWMVEKGVMPKVEVDRLKKITAEMVKMESFTLNSDVNLGDLAETVGPMMDFYLRIAGSSLGARAQSLLPGDSSGGSLVAASAGSKAFRTAYSKIFSSIPESMKMDVMTQMMRDPDLLAVMLKKGRTDRERSAIGSRLTDLLVEKGLVPAGRAAANFGRRALPGIVRERDESIQREIQQLESELPPNDQQGAFVPPPVQQRPSPVVSPTTQASAVPSPAPAPVNSGPVDRTRYAALFPNDSISGMMKTQMLSRGGIASLMR